MPQPSEGTFQATDEDGNEYTIRTRRVWAHVQAESEIDRRKIRVSPRTILETEEGRKVREIGPGRFEIVGDEAIQLRVDVSG